MSVLDIVVRDGEGLVAVDTDAVAPYGPPVHVDQSKATILPHARAIIAGRGVVSMIWDAAGAAASAGLDTDRIIAALPNLARAAWHGVGMINARMGLGDPVPSQLAVVGWSASERAVIGARVERDPHGEWIATRMRNCTYASPWEGDLIARSPATSIAELQDLAAAQVSLIRRDHPTMAGGGELLVGRVTRDQVGFVSLGTIRQPASMGARMVAGIG